MLELGLAGFETGDARLIGLGAGPRGPSSVRLATAGCMCVCEREEGAGGWSFLCSGVFRELRLLRRYVGGIGWS